MNTLLLIEAVAREMERLYGIQTTVEYPGFIAIAERQISDDVDASDDVWAVGLGDEPGTWTGQLTTADGNSVGPCFCVRPKSGTFTAIASAIYTHGIGDLYVGGGCTDLECPVVKVSR